MNGIRALFKESQSELADPSAMWSPVEDTTFDEQPSIYQSFGTSTYQPPDCE